MTQGSRQASTRHNQLGRLQTALVHEESQLCIVRKRSSCMRTMIALFSAMHACLLAAQYICSVLIDGSRVMVLDVAEMLELR